MATSKQSRIGTAPEEGIKAPCVTATTANITLSGLQTIDTVAVPARARVLAKDQIDASENGIWIAGSGAWKRATDFNSDADIGNGVLVVNSNSLKIYKITYTEPWDVGVTDITFSEVFSVATIAADAAAAAASEAAAEAALDEFTDLYLGAKAADPTLDNDGDALQTGALYWYTVTSVMKAYDGAAWQVVFASGDAATLDGIDSTGFAQIAASKWSAIEQLGTALSIASNTIPDISAMSNERIASVGPGSFLYAYDWSANGWTQTGNGKAIPLSDLTDTAFLGIHVTAMSGTRVAVLQEYYDTGTFEKFADLQTWDFDGSDWTQVGSTKNITDIDEPGITSLSGTEIALVDEGVGDLVKWTFNGSTWSASAGLALGLSGSPERSAIATLDANTVAIISGTTITAYAWATTVFAQSGNPLTISILGGAAVTSLNGTDVVVISKTSTEIRIYRWDGSDFAKVNLGTWTISGVGLLAISAMSGNTISFFDGTNLELRTYLLSLSVIGEPLLLQ
jgi:hypothetical protein